MSKRKDKKKKNEEVVEQKYIPENLIEELGRRNNDYSEKIIVFGELNTGEDEKNDKECKVYIKDTKDNNEKLEEKERENAILNREIKKIHDEKEDFERNCKENFAKKFEEVQNEKRNAIEKITDEMNELKDNLEQTTSEKDELIEKVKKLETEIKRLNHVNNITIHNYENKINDLNTRHHNKIKNTTEIFENFLKNNQELLKNDLYTVYRNLKLKFDLKLKECIDFKEKNNRLEEKNREYKLSMDNNDDIINECAKEQLETKKKTQKLTEELENRNTIIESMKQEYNNQLFIINEKFSKILQENAEEIQNLKFQIEDRDRKILIAQQNSKEVINSRSELELFFIDQLKECRKEIIKKRKMENDKKNCYLPYLNKSNTFNSKNDTSNITKDDSIYITSVKKVDIKDMDPESKEKLLRSILVKLNDGGTAKEFKKLRNTIK